MIRWFHYKANGESVDAQRLREELRRMQNEIQ